MSDIQIKGFMSGMIIGLFFCAPLGDMTPVVFVYVLMLFSFMLGIILTSAFYELDTEYTKEEK